jgi:hypothetical protein
MVIFFFFRFWFRLRFIPAQTCVLVGQIRAMISFPHFLLLWRFDCVSRLLALKSFG